jgi:hypothetical protein
VTRDEWIEKEIAAKEKVMTLDAHNRSTLRSVLGREHDYWEAEAIREDSHSHPVEGI